MWLGKGCSGESESFQYLPIIMPAQEMSPIPTRGRTCPFTTLSGLSAYFHVALSPSRLMIPRIDLTSGYAFKKKANAFFLMANGSGNRPTSAILPYSDSGLPRACLGRVISDMLLLP